MESFLSALYPTRSIIAHLDDIYESLQKRWINWNNFIEWMTPCKHCEDGTAHTTTSCSDFMMEAYEDERNEYAYYMSLVTDLEILVIKTGNLFRCTDLSKMKGSRAIHIINYLVYCVGVDAVFNGLLLKLRDLYEGHLNITGQIRDLELEQMVDRLVADDQILDLEIVVDPVDDWVDDDWQDLYVNEVFFRQLASVPAQKKKSNEKRGKPNRAHYMKEDNRPSKPVLKKRTAQMSRERMIRNDMREIRFPISVS